MVLLALTAGFPRAIEIPLPHFTSVSEEELTAAFYSGLDLGLYCYSGMLPEFIRFPRALGDTVQRNLCRLSWMLAWDQHPAATGNLPFPPGSTHCDVGSL